MMKKIILIFFFIFSNFICFSQVYKWRASVYSTRQSFDNGQNWQEWSVWNPSGVLIVAQDQRVMVYSASNQVYDMIENVVKTSDKDDNPIYSVGCVDEHGSRCKMIWYHNNDAGSYVIFQFSNLELMYKVVPLD